MWIGTISKQSNSTITKEEFTLLQKTANRIIGDISKEIMKGNIEIKPTYKKKTKETACKYCTYKGICGFDSRLNTYAYIGDKTKEMILGEMEEE